MSALFVAMSALFVAMSALFVAMSALFVAISALFVAISALFVAMSALFVAISALFVAISALFVAISALFFAMSALLVSTCVFTSFNCLKLTASPSAAPAATLVIFLSPALMPVVVTDGPPVMVRPFLLIVTLLPDLNSSLVTLSSPVSFLFRLSL